MSRDKTYIRILKCHTNSPSLNTVVLNFSSPRPNPNLKRDPTSINNFAFSQTTQHITLDSTFNATLE